MPAEKLSTQVFTNAVAPLIEFLEKKFEGKPIPVSDIKDKFGHQYVDLVQEGGGVHGVALAGYTYVLEKMGIRFMKMAGTSAGSINTLLLNAVYTKQEADDLKKEGVYYETRSEKVLEYLANKPLSEMVDGHPMWRKLLLNMFSGTVGMGGIIKSVKKLKGRAVMAGMCLLLLVISALGLAFYREPNTIFFIFKWITILSAIILLASISYIIGRIVFVRLLYKHGEWLGINPGDDFENWIKEKVLEDNRIFDVNDLKKKIKEEADEFNYKYEKAVRKPLALAPVLVESENFKTILDRIKNPSVKVDEVFDDLAVFLSGRNKYLQDSELYELQLMLDAFEERLADDPRIITKEIVIVSSDITHEVKVEFPGMHQMYWGDDYSISPAKYVRASMSVPFFFKPFQIDFNPGEMLTIKREWFQYMKVQKQMEPCALLVDGGMLSNFPINVFYNPDIPVPRKPTFGIKLEYDDDTAPKSVKSLLGLGGKLISTMRFFYDREFILKHDMYKKTVRSIDTGNIHWLNFNLSDEEKIELFFRGALAATLFLAKHSMTDAEVKEMIAKGKDVKFGDKTFSIFHKEPMIFRTEDCLVENSTFEWGAYKLERLLDRAEKKNRTQHLKKETLPNQQPTVMNDVFTYTINIPDFSQLLLWLILLCFLGCCITLWPMLIMSKFFLRKDGTPFSILLFQLPFSISKFQSLVDNISGRTKDTVRMNLKMDYYFMPFVYLLLLFGGWYVLHRQQFSFGNSDYYKLLFVPLVAWVFDIVENKTALASIKSVTKSGTRTLFIVALLKWALIIGYLVFVAAIGFNILN